MTNTPTTAINTKDEFKLHREISNTNDVLLDCHQVGAIIHRKRTWIYHAVLRGAFPKAVAIGRNKFWRLSDVNAWVAAL